MYVFTLPDPGEGLIEAEIANWCVREGDQVKVNDIIVEIETAKSLVELPSPVAGVIAKVLVKEGQTVAVGSPIIEIETADAPSDAPTPILVGRGADPESARSSRRRRKRGQTVEAKPEPAPAPAPEPVAEEHERAVTLAKPLVRKLAHELRVALSSVRGTGPHGVIRREDVEAAARRKGRLADAEGPAEWRVPIRGVRKATARNLVASVTEHVTVTEWLDVDVTALVDLVAALKTRDDLNGERVSPLLLVSKAACKALGKYPDLNASWDERHGEIVYHRDVNLGIAADTPRGLMVPNIKAAQRHDLASLAVEMNALVRTARADQLTPADLRGGTFTITNVGVFGVDSGTPIINGDESAILCLGAITRRPWVVGEPGADRIEPRWVMTLALSFDHRLIDGAGGSQFLREVADLLTQPALILI